MAVSFDTSAMVVGGSATTRSQSVTVASNSDRLLVAIIGVSGASSGDASGVAFTAGDTGNLTFLGKQAGSQCQMEIWYRIAPATGSNTVQATWASAPGGDTMVCLMSFYGVDQTTAINAFTSNSTIGSLGTVASSANNMVVCGITCNANGTITNGTTDQTGVWNNYYDVAHSAGSASFQWTFSGTGFGLESAVAANINEVAAATGQPTAKRFGGVPGMGRGSPMGGGSVWKNGILIPQGVFA